MTGYQQFLLCCLSESIVSCRPTSMKSACIWSQQFNTLQLAAGGKVPASQPTKQPPCRATALKEEKSQSSEERQQKEVAKEEVPVKKVVSPEERFEEIKARGNKHVQKVSTCACSVNWDLCFWFHLHEKSSFNGNKSVFWVGMQLQGCVWLRKKKQPLMLALSWSPSEIFQTAWW